MIPYTTGQEWVIYLAVAALLILVGAFTKSAQFPFHEWLSGAMEGPTPVSAFLHSSTMVKAGVFLTVLLLPLFVKLNLLWPMLLIGTITAVIGAITALTSDHIKKILAYSTIEDLGLMFVAIGLNALPAALIFFTVQALYKALLLMSSGTIMKANDDRTSIYRVSSFGRNRLLFVSALIGALSISGIFPFSGFFGKVAVDSAASSNAIVYAVLTAVDFLTALYIFRWLLVPMENQKKAHQTVYSAGYSLLKKSMQIPQLVLAILIILFSIIFVYNGVAQQANLDHSIVEMAASSFGAITAYIMFKKAKNVLSEGSRSRKILYTGSAFNMAYLYMAKFFGLVAHAIEIFDNGLNRLFYMGSSGVMSLAGSVKIAEKGNINTYIAALAIGLILVFIILVFVP